MKIVVVGASGRIGSKVVQALLARHRIVNAGVGDGDVQVDYTDETSVRSMFEQIGRFDALICVAGGDSVFKPYSGLEDEDYRFVFHRKFLSQVRLLRLGEAYCTMEGRSPSPPGFSATTPTRPAWPTGR